MQDQPQRLKFFELIKSAFMAMIGIQKNSVRERDFSKGRARDFILLGIVMSVLFVLSILALVSFVIAMAT